MLACLLVLVMRLKRIKQIGKRLVIGLTFNGPKPSCQFCRSSIIWQDLTRWTLLP